jgi:hypothetical protein
MAILIGKPTSLAPGATSGTITLSPSTLISQMSITNPYFANSANWNRVTFVYRDGTGSEQVGMFFKANTAVWGVSTTARQNMWQVAYIIIYDFDNGTYVIPRSSFTTANEFDILIDPTAGLVAPQLRFNPSLANGGVGPYSDGTTANGTVWTESVSGNNGTYNEVGSLGQWKGVGTGADPYRLKLSSTQYNVTFNSVVTPGTYQHVVFWAKADASGWTNYQQVLVNSASTPYVEIGSSNIITQGPSVNVFTYTPPTTTWHMWGFTRDSSGNNVITLDGVAIDTFTNAGVLPLTLTYLLGANLGFSTGMNGSMGDIWTFDTVLLTSDVLAYYNATKANYGL